MKLKFLFLPFCIYILFSCQKAQTTNSDKPSGLPGETLAKMHCGSCHEYVPPEMLDKNTWEKRTLPEMALRMGVGDVFEKNVLQIKQGAENLVYENIYPLEPTIHEEDYQKILKFYLENAPEKPLPQADKEKPEGNLPDFEYQPLLYSDGFLNNTTALTVEKQSQKIFAGSPRGMIKTFQPENAVIKEDSIFEPGVFSAMKQHKGDWYFLDLGRLGPHERPVGKLIKYNRGASSVVLDKLHKPADFQFFDVNSDGVEDIVVCNFGFETGSLAWYDGKTKEEHVIKKIPGARNVFLEDMDGDGHLDLVVLYAQALESISVFYSNGKGRFKEKVLLNFPPVYGSSWFQLADFNGDGKPDILYVNGDNADYSYTLKNYHGIRIYENKGKNNFELAYFYPMYGATKAIPMDFDGDGNLDIAAIAYYRDQPEEGFMLFKNKGNYRFDPYTFPEVTHGRWMSLEVADVNRDGKPDILLGAHDLARPSKKDENAAEVVMLLNKSKTTLTK